MSNVKIGIIGSGDRIKKTYLPILKNFPINIELVGFTSRDKENRAKFTSETGLREFTNARELVTQTIPDFLLVAVSSEFNCAVIDSLLDFGVPIIAETPLAWSKSQGTKLVNRSKQLNIPIYIMEQTPYLPLEQLKYELLSSNLFGKIYAAYNDFVSYSYHGVAQLRRYVNASPISLRSSEFVFSKPVNSYAQIQKWQLAEITCDDGSVLIHHYSDQYSDSPISFPSAIRLYGENATMVNDEIRMVATGQQSPIIAKVSRIEDNDGILQSLSIYLAENGTFTWNNPFSAYKFNDEQIAVASLMLSILSKDEQGLKPYTADEFLHDIEIVQAIHLSACSRGGLISLPLNENIQKLYKLFNFRLLLKKIRQILS